jgi:hypothetical protein
VTSERNLNTWDDQIEYQRERGLTADEIADVFDHHPEWFPEIPTRSGEWLDWKLLHGRRRIRALIATICGDPTVAEPRPAPSGAEWRELVIAYRKTNGKRPTQESVAGTLGISEDTLRKRVRGVGIKRWHDVHAWIAAAPE